MNFYRCIDCGSVVNEWDIERGSCPKCGGHKIKYTNLSLWEEIVQLVKHPILIKEVLLHMREVLTRKL